MLYQIASFLLDVAAGLLGSACLLRLYMQAQRTGFANPVGRFVFALTDWLVLPLRRVVPPVGRWDMSSLVGAFLLELGQFGLLWLLSGARASWAAVPVLAAFGVVRLAVSGLSGLVIVHAILSWVGTGSPLSGVIDRLSEPLLRPLRRVLPLVGGVDLSPLAALVGLQVVAMLIAALQASVLS